MLPPTKRQKRQVVESSPSAPSDHELESGPTKTQPRTKPAHRLPNAPSFYLPSRARAKNGIGKSPSRSPEKAMGKGILPEKSKSGDILKLFTSQIQRQKTTTNGINQGKVQGHVSHQAEKIYDEHISDISDDEDVGDGRALSSSFVGAASKKRVHNASLGDEDIISSVQRFVRQPPAKRDGPKEEDMRPWAERFAPLNLVELAVHSRKVADVRSWLESVMNCQVRQRLLILKGAAGTGKTTTIKLLAKDMDCDLLEWRNPGSSVASTDGFVSMAAQFEEFMGRGGKYGQLEMFSEEVTEPSKPTTKPLDRRKSMILVEDFPNTFTRSSTALQSFRSTVLQYLASKTPSLSMMYNNAANTNSITPLILVISETMLTTLSASADSFTAHRLLGPEILQHPGTTVIEFNPIAPTLLAKALELVVIKEARKSGRRKTPGPLVLKRLGEIGDVRSAVASLEFLCVRGDDGSDWGARVPLGKGRKTGKGGIPLTRMESESLELITRREASLGIFHAVGRVVYNKRDETPISTVDGNSIETFPDCFADRARPKRSQVAVEELIDEIGTDTQTFIAALHENYILSCDAPSTSYEFSDLDHVNGCIDALSDSDLLSPSRDGTFNSTSFSGAVGSGSSNDTLRKDEFCFQTAVRGILFSLPNPVKRRAPAVGGLRTGKRGDEFKMFYPTSLKLWRMKEEIETTIELWVRRLMRGEDYSMSSITSGAAAFAKPKPGRIETWRNMNHMGTPAENKSKAQEPEVAALLGTGTSAKEEMLLERLPYMVLIGKGGSTAFAIKDMEKITVFKGIGGTSEELDEEGEEGPLNEEWATDKPIEAGESPPNKAAVNNGWTRRIGQGNNGLEARITEQKLTLSDDDIEDD